MLTLVIPAERVVATSFRAILITFKPKWSKDARMADLKKKQAPLKWRQHETQSPRSTMLDSLTQSVQQKMERTSSSPTATESSTELAVWLPELPEQPLEKAVRLLQAAAEVEHALMVQYLYSGYGFSSPQRDILDVAIEEMSHLMTVQNLLLLIGSRPHLARQDFGSAASDDERLFPFDLLLEPASHLSLAKYVVAESPEHLPAGVDPGVMNHIGSLAIQGTGVAVNRVGVLYALLGVVLGSEQMLLQKAATGDPWYVTVNGLAAEAAIFYGGRDKLHLPDNAFQPGTESKQGSDHDWDRSLTKSIDEFRVFVVTNREEALDAIRDIGLQGEGPGSIPTEVSHFKRFYDLFIKFFGPNGLGTGLPPGASIVPAAAIIVVDENSVDPNAISHPSAVPLARLADLRYSILLGSLQLYFDTPVADRGFLRGWCFAEMFAIKMLARFLTGLPRTPTSNPGEVAAFPFNLPPWAGNSIQWTDLSDVLSESVVMVSQILPTMSVGSEEARILELLGSSDQRKLAEANARMNGGTVMRKADAVRDILDWVAGAGNPRHNGNSPTLGTGRQGRFWNLQLDAFKQTEVSGTNIVALPDPELIEVLRSGFMPLSREPLDQTSHEFQFLEAWVNGGCKDEPL